MSESRDVHVVLDLDATLILSIEKEVPKKKATLPPNSPRRQRMPDDRRLKGNLANREEEWFDIDEMGLRVHLRPHLVRFLVELFQNATTVSIWSAGSTEYVRAIAKNLQRLTKRKFTIVWSLPDCADDGTGYPVKPIGKIIESPEGQRIGMRIDNTVLIDDLQDNFDLSPNNVYQISPYAERDPYDYYLLEALRMVMQIRGKSRPVRKAA